MRNTLAILFGLTLASGAAVAGDKSFNQLDTDASGDLSRAEISAAEVDFSKADADGNGKVSKSEYQASAKTGGSTDQGESTY